MAHFASLTFAALVHEDIEFFALDLFHDFCIDGDAIEVRRADTGGLVGGGIANEQDAIKGHSLGCGLFGLFLAVGFGGGVLGLGNQIDIQNIASGDFHLRSTVFDNGVLGGHGEIS